MAGAAPPVLALAFFCLMPMAAARAQTQGNVIVDANEQLFAIFAARRAAGYDAGPATGSGGELRDELAAILARKDLPVLPELRAFFDQRRVADDAAADLGQYVSLALLVGPPPDFRLTVPQSDLPPDARALVGLIPLLKKFCGQADLTELWADFRARYDAEILHYSEPVRKTIGLSDAYFGFPSGAYLGRTYHIWLSLLGAAEQVHARIYRQDYHLVVMPAKEPKVAEIRHLYLHFLLDPLAVKYAPEINRKSELRMIAREAPQLGLDLKHDFPFLFTECLIRAAELRMDKRPPAEAESTVGELTAAGLILVPYFFKALADYEKQEASFNMVYRGIIEGIDTAKETKRLATVKFAPKTTAQTPAAPALSEEERLLDQADSLIAEARYNEAKSLYQEVLDRLNPRSEGALFGLAVVASNTRKPNLAEDYFRKTLEAARDLRIVTWSHIYLGRLYDLKGDRDKALSEYRAASLTAATYPDALRAVQTGMRRPFGAKQ